MTSKLTTDDHSEKGIQIFLFGCIYCQDSGLDSIRVQQDCNPACKGLQRGHTPHMKNSNATRYTVFAEGNMDAADEAETFFTTNDLLAAVAVVLAERAEIDPDDGGAPTFGIVDERKDRLVTRGDVRRAKEDR